MKKLKMMSSKKLAMTSMSPIRLKKVSTVKFSKVQFSTLSCFQVNERTKTIWELEELKAEKDSLNYDSSLIKDAVRAASKITTGETPSKEEASCMEELKSNYPAFFESDEEEERSKPSYSLLTKVMTVKNYIKKELRVNRDTTIKLEEKVRILGESSKRPIIEQDKSAITESAETSLNVKGKSPEIFTSDKGKSRAESSQNTSLPDDFFYNPFDDIGTD